MLSCNRYTNVSKTNTKSNNNTKESNNYIRHQYTQSDTRSDMYTMNVMDRICMEMIKKISTYFLAINISVKFVWKLKIPYDDYYSLHHGTIS